MSLRLGDLLGNFRNSTGVAGLRVTRLADVSVAGDSAAAVPVNDTAAVDLTADLRGGIFDSCRELEVSIGSGMIDRGMWNVKRARKRG